MYNGSIMNEKKKGLLDNEHFKKLSLRQKFTALWYALKYYAQGDDWEFALDYAVSLIKGWKRY